MSGAPPAAPGSSRPSESRRKASAVASRAIGLARPFGVAVALVLGTAATVELHLEARDRARMSAGQTFLDVRGRKIRYRLVGQDRPGPTIALLSGYTSGIEQWRLGQARLSAIAPVLTYDRAGTGLSDPSEGHDAASEAEELASFATLGGVQRRFVVVGYSSSGLIARAFARLYPDLVAGLVFLDVTTPEEIAASAWRDVYARRVLYERVALMSMAKSAFGWMRLRHSLLGGPRPDTPEDERSSAVLEMASHWWAVYQEGAAIAQSAEEAKLDWSNVTVPIAVLSLGSEDGPKDSRDRYRWQRGMAEAAKATFVHHPEWKHSQISEDPAVVAQVAELISGVVDRSVDRTSTVASRPSGEGTIEKIVQPLDVVDGRRVDVPAVPGARHDPALRPGGGSL